MTGKKNYHFRKMRKNYCYKKIKKNIKKQLILIFISYTKFAILAIRFILFFLQLYYENMGILSCIFDKTVCFIFKSPGQISYLFTCFGAHEIYVVAIYWLFFMYF